MNRASTAIERNGARPDIAPTARIASTARLIGDVTVGDHCVIDYGAVVSSSGPPVVLEPGVVVMSNAVIRSVGGDHRPAYAVSIGAGTLIGPLAALAGCAIGDDCYIATGVMVFHGAIIGAGSRLGAGSIVHTGVELPPASHVAIRHYAVTGSDHVLVTADVDEAHALLAHVDFFARAFATKNRDMAALHRQSVARLRAEAADWSDLQPFGIAEEPARSH